MNRYAPAGPDGLYPYVITKTSWGRSWERIEWERSLADAKLMHGWTRELHTSVKVRRATPADLERVGDAS